MHEHFKSTWYLPTKQLKHLNIEFPLLYNLMVLLTTFAWHLLTKRIKTKTMAYVHQWNSCVNSSIHRILDSKQHVPVAALNNIALVTTHFHEFYFGWSKITRLNICYWWMVLTITNDKAKQRQFDAFENMFGTFSTVNFAINCVRTKFLCVNFELIEFHTLLLEN